MANKWSGPAAILGLVLLGGVGFVALKPKPDDQVQIQNALESAIQAGREGRPGSVLEQLSASFEINGQAILNRAEVARFIKEQKPNVKVQSTLAEVDGDNAHILTPITLEMSGPFKMSGTIPNVRIEFKREASSTFFFIPSREWKLTNVEVPAESWAQLMLGL